MLESQRETYGDGLDQQALHPYMWAAKGHYYSGSSFYNFPYMFGLLFGLGLYAQYQQDPEGFKVGYDELLASTGLAGSALDVTREPFRNEGRLSDLITSGKLFGDLGLPAPNLADIDRFEALARRAEPESGA